MYGILCTLAGDTGLYLNWTWSVKGMISSVFAGPGGGVGGGIIPCTMLTWGLGPWEWGLGTFVIMIHYISDLSLGL